MTSTRELVHPRTRNAFRDHCSDVGTIRTVERAFADEGIDPIPWTQESDADGQRRGVFDRCTANVDWSDVRQVRLVLNAFETISRWGDGEWGDGARARLAQHLRRDGWSVGPDGRISALAGNAVESIPLGDLRDPSAILEQLDRLRDSMDRTPGDAISSAKALIEATAKVVLTELEAEFDPEADIPTLVKAAQKALRLHPDTLAPTAKGTEIIKRVLSNLSSVAIGVAELRNAYAPDHGRATAVVGLGPRHAHLAVGCAATYCTMLLETLQARRAQPKV